MGHQIGAADQFLAFLGYTLFADEWLRQNTDFWKIFFAAIKVTSNLHPNAQNIHQSSECREG
jgi:hypothetical protein